MKFPGNILLDRQGLVKILDMGLARFSRDLHDNITDVYQLNQVSGTVDYQAPEQATNSHAVDHSGGRLQPRGRTFQVTSTVHSYHDRAEIVVVDPNEIRLLD
jgi:serine/threonine protein kinase